MDYEKVTKSVEPHELVKKRHLGGSRTCEGTPHEERKSKADAI